MGSFFKFLLSPKNSKAIKKCKQTHSGMFREALFIIIRNWKKPKRSSGIGILATRINTLQLDAKI